MSVPSIPDERVRVELGERAYDVVVGSGLLERAGELLQPILRRKRIFVVTDQNVAQRHGDRLQRGLRAAAIEPLITVLPPGEGTKNLTHLGGLLDSVLDQRPE